MTSSGELRKAADFNRANIIKASSVVHLADRNKLARVDDEDLDADTLFTYLKIEKHIPVHVFFTAELTFESNMVVLNSNVVQHQLQNNALVLAQKQAEEFAAAAAAAAQGGTESAVVATPTSSLKGGRKSSYSDIHVNNNNNAAGSGNSSPMNITAVAEIEGKSSSPLSIGGLRPGGGLMTGDSDRDLLNHRGSLKSQMSFKKISRFEKAASRVHVGVGGGGGGVGGRLESMEEEEEKHLGKGDENMMREELLGGGGSRGKDKTGGESSRGGGHQGENVPPLDNVLRKKIKDKEKANFFSISRTHHTLPVFASGITTTTTMLV